MTTTMLFSKKSFWNNIKNVIKENRGIALLWLGITIVFFLGFSGYETINNSTYPNTPFYGDISAPYLMISVVLIPLIVSAMLNRYMHNKTAVDVYHSLPITRRELLLSNTFAGMIIVSVPVIISYLIHITTFIIMTKNMSNIGNYFLDMLCWVIIAFTVYIISTFICINVGNSFDQMVFSLGFIFAPLVILLNFIGIISSWMYGYGLLHTKTMEFLGICPVATLVARLYVSVEIENIGFSLIYTSNLIAVFIWLAIAITLLLVSVRMYTNRKSEIAQTDSTNKVISVVIKFLGVALFAPFMGWLFNDQAVTPNNYINGMAFTIGTLVGCVISYIIIDAIISRGFKGFIKRIPIGAAASGVVMAFIVTLNLGAFGFETRVPNISNIESVSISYLGRFSNIRSTGYVSKPEGINNSDNYTRISSGDGALHIRQGEFGNIRSIDFDGVLLSGEKEKAIVNKVHQNIVDNIDILKGGINDTEEYYDAMTGVTSYSVVDRAKQNLNIEYTMKNGSKMQRQYVSVYLDMVDELAELETSEQFLAQVQPVMTLKVEDILEINVKNSLDSKESAPKSMIPSEQYGKLLETLRQDILNEPISEITNPSHDIVGILSFSVENEFSKQLKLLKTGESKRITEPSFKSENYVVPISYNYTETIKLIKSLTNENVFEIDIDSIDAVNILIDQGGYKQYQLINDIYVVSDNYLLRRMANDVNTITIEDKDTINLLMEEKRSTYYHKNEYVNICFIYNGVYSQGKLVQIDKLPESVKEKIYALNQTDRY